MRVGVLGGGFQGCCAALELASRGAKVTIFDRADALLTRAAVANEGKVHLGFMYAGDPTLRTARTMIEGALAFAPFLRRHLGCSVPFATSAPASYLVHRNGQIETDAFARYVAAVHRLIDEAAAGRSDAYFGLDLNVPRPCSGDDWENRFDGEHVLAAFATPEVAINPTALGAAIRACVAEHPRIEARLRSEVVGVEDAAGGLRVRCADAIGEEDGFDHLINALWEGRLALDEKIGARPDRPWIHRLKYGVSFRLPSGAPAVPSATVVLGPFGEVVSYGGGLIYLTWYPTCIRGFSKELSPPHWPTYPDEPLRSEILSGTLAALAEIVPALRGFTPDDLLEATVRGGVIVAWGQTDIDDPKSELHRRYEIGVTSRGGYHSVDPGKLTMAPYFADVVAERILPRGSGPWRG